MSNQKGFSLMEMLVTLAILGIFLAAAIPSYNLILQKSRVSKARNDVELIQLAASVYRLDHNNAYPTNMNQLTSGGVNAYLKFLPVDPWGHAYVFNNQRVMSYGADGSAGGSAMNADIISSDSL